MKITDQEREELESVMKKLASWSDENLERALTSPDPLKRDLCLAASDAPRDLALRLKWVLTKKRDESEKKSEKRKKNLKKAIDRSPHKP